MNKKPENEIGPPPTCHLKKTAKSRKKGNLVGTELSKLKKGNRFSIESEEMVYEYVIEARDNLIVCLVLSGEEVVSTSLINGDTIVYREQPKLIIKKKNLLNLIRELDPDWEILAILNECDEGFFDCYMNGCKGFNQFSTKEQEEAINKFFSKENSWSYDLKDFVADFSNFIENYDKNLDLENIKIKIVE